MLMRVLIGVMIIVAIALGATFYSGYVDQSNTADSLASKNLTSEKAVKTILNSNKSLESDIADLAAQIDQARINLNLANKPMPEMTNSNVIVRKIITFGDSVGVSVIPLSTTDWTQSRIDNNAYHVFKMEVEINGPRQKVIDYIKKIQDSIDNYLVIESLTMTPKETTNDISGTEATQAPIIALINPTAMYTGGSVVITGNHFTGVTNVSFGGVSATSFIVNSDVQITAVVALGSSGSVTVSNPIGTSEYPGFTYLGATPPLATPATVLSDTKINVNFAIYAK
jgi:hypothetical protein